MKMVKRWIMLNIDNVECIISKIKLKKNKKNMYFQLTSPSLLQALILQKQGYPLISIFADKNRVLCITIKQNCPNNCFYCGWYVAWH